MPNDNIYNSAIPKKNKKRCFNSDNRNLSDSAHNITPEETAQAKERLANLIRITKEQLNYEND